MKSATGLTGSGSRDWFIQRVSAVILAIYTVVIFAWILCNGGFSYEHWLHMLGLACGRYLLTMSRLVKWVHLHQVYASY